MSRTVTPPTAQPVGSSPGTAVRVPREKIAQLAYEKWLKRGRTHGNDLQDWVEAEAELAAQMSRSASGSTTFRR